MAALFSPQRFENTCGLLIDTWVLKYWSREEMHYHDCIEIGLCTKGSGVCFVRDKIIPFVQGQITFVNANEPHIFQSHSSMPSNWLFLYIAPRLTKNVPLPPNGVYRNSSAETIVRILWELKCKGSCPDSAFSHLSSALPAVLCDNNKAPQEITAVNTLEKILPAVEYISQHYQENLNIGKLASMCYLSESFFRRCFRDSMNDSPHAYLNRVRLAFAESLLLSSEASIISISHASGFESLSSFNRSFRKAHNMTPREYRAKNRIELIV